MVLKAGQTPRCIAIGRARNDGFFLRGGTVRELDCHILKKIALQKKIDPLRGIKRVKK